MNLKKILFLLVATFSLPNVAQQNTSNDPTKELGIWYMYNGSHQISKNFSLKSMAHFRFFDIADDMQQFIGRLGANYKLNKTISATLGYAFLNTDTTFKNKGGDFNEHRIYEDLNIQHKVAALSLAHRFRAEQRFLEHTTGHFIRYQLALSHPINKKWTAYLYDEVFFDFEGEAFNQNWLGAGVKYKLSKTCKLQLGYMKVLNDFNASFDRIQLGIAINTHHRKNN